MLASTFSILFLSVLGSAVFLGRLPKTIIIIYITMSVIAFIAYGIDKSAARRGKWRTPEKTLQVIGLLCGWPGAVAAQKFFRHKSSKASFQMFFWTSVILNCSALALFYMKGLPAF